MKESHVMLFAEVGRCLGAAATSLGLKVPSFRTPPRVAGVDRTIRRSAGGSVLVSVRSRGRAWPAVVADMIEGVVHANDLGAPDASRVRNELWQAVDGLETKLTSAAEPVRLPLHELPPAVAEAA